MKIAVITENLELANFYKLELMYRGFEVELFSSISDMGDGYIMSIIDVDTYTSNKKPFCRSVSVSSLINTDITPDACSLVWPTPIADIDMLCKTFMFGEMGSDHGVRFEDTPVLLADSQNSTIILDRETIRFTKNEFKILMELCKESGKTVKRERIMEILDADSGNISDVYIYHLRKKLEGQNKKRLIFTERGVGYRTFLKLKG